MRRTNGHRLELSLAIRTAPDLRKLRTTCRFVSLTPPAASVESGLLRAVGAAESGNRMGPPGKAVRLTGRTWLCGGEDQLAAQAGQLGRPQSPTKGRYHKETETAA